MAKNVVRDIGRTTYSTSTIYYVAVASTYALLYYRATGVTVSRLT